jgi:hypothetical protein
MTRQASSEYWLDAYGRQMIAQSRQRLIRCIGDFVGAICDSRTNNKEAENLITDTLDELVEARAQLKEYFTDDWPKGI